MDRPAKTANRLAPVVPCGNQKRPRQDSTCGIEAGPSCTRTPASHGDASKARRTCWERPPIQVDGQTLPQYKWMERTQRRAGKNPGEWMAPNLLKVVAVTTYQNERATVPNTYLNKNIFSAASFQTLFIKPSGDRSPTIAWECAKFLIRRLSEMGSQSSSHWSDEGLRDLWALRQGQEVAVRSDPKFLPRTGHRPSLLRW